MMHFREVAARITGISVPVFGVQWSPPTLDVQIARKVLSFLEDRRVLFSPYFLEHLEHCVDSVIQIRIFLTNVLGDGGIGQELSDCLRAIRAACRRFLDEVTQSSNPLGRALGIIYVDPDTGERTVLEDLREGNPPLEVESFYRALGGLRAHIGMQIAQISVRYGIDLEPELASVLPPVDED